MFKKAKQKVTEITIAAGQGVKSGAVYLGNAIDEAKNEVDRKSLRPVFKDTLDQTTSNDHVPLPELVCIVEHDKSTMKASSVMDQSAIGKQ